MAQKHAVIDITDNAELLRTVERVTASQAQGILRTEHGRAAKIGPHSCQG